MSEVSRLPVQEMAKAVALSDVQAYLESLQAERCLVVPLARKGCVGGFLLSTDLKYHIYLLIN